MTYRARAYVNENALKHNLDRIQEIASRSKILAMIKANAYGHGILHTAKVLKNASAFGVASIYEALLLRRNDIEQPIVVMSGFYNLEELKFLLEHQVEAVIHETLQVELLEQLARESSNSRKLNAWLKIDSGMHRLGFQPQYALEIYQRLKKLSNIHSIKLMTHLADADNTDQQYTQTQIKTFNELTAHLALEKSIANSAAILAYPNTHHEWVRPGIMLYGVSPFAHRTGAQEGLQQAMTLKANVIAIKTIKKGDFVGYGCSWECTQEMPIGIISIGYGDGYPRHAKNGTPVLVNGVICPLVGRVSMDMIAVDLRPQPYTHLGDEAILWGKGLPAEKVAAYADTIAYELFCSVTQRVEFIYENSPYSLMEMNQ